MGASNVDADDAHHDGDDHDPVEHDDVAVTATKIPCYELCYSKAGEDIKVRVYDEMTEVDGMQFVDLSPHKQCICRWLLECTKLRKLKHRNDRCTDLVGLVKLRELRNLQTIVQQTGGASSLRQVARPSMFLFKKLEVQGKLGDRSAVVEINVEGKVVRVLSREKRDKEVVWVCTEDLVPCIDFIKNQGICKDQDDDLPVGIHKRKRKDSTIYEVRKKSGEGKAKYLLAKNLQAAIELQEQL